MFPIKTKFFENFKALLTMNSDSLAEMNPVVVCLEEKASLLTVVNKSKSILVDLRKSRDETEMLLKEDDANDPQVLLEYKRSIDLLALEIKNLETMIDDSMDKVKVVDEHLVKDFGIVEV